MKCVIIQPNYLPWRGYFDLIHDADVFIYLDDVQYTLRDWRNRNQILTRQGLRWISVPVIKTTRDTLIHQVQIHGQDWVSEHHDLVKENYRHTSCYSEVMNLLQSVWSQSMPNLSDLDIALTDKICEYLGVRTRRERATHFQVGGKATQRLLELCLKVGADHYISGPSAKSYLDEELMAQHGVRVSYKEYSYPPYDQGGEAFEPGVSIIDLLCRFGKESTKYIWECHDS